MTEERLKQIERRAPSVASGGCIGELCAEVRRLCTLVEEQQEANATLLARRDELIRENDRLRERLAAGQT